MFCLNHFIFANFVNEKRLKRMWDHSICTICSATICCRWDHRICTICSVTFCRRWDHDICTIYSVMFALWVSGRRWDHIVYYEPLATIFRFPFGVG